MRKTNNYAENMPSGLLRDLSGRPAPDELVFQVRLWVSINAWKKHPMAYHKQHQAWARGTDKKRPFWAGAAGEFYAQWTSAGKPEFKGPVMVECYLFFTGQAQGRDRNNYSPKWLLDLIHIPRKNCGGYHYSLIEGDTHDICDYHVEIIENARHDRAVIRVAPTI